MLKEAKARMNSERETSINLRKDVSDESCVVEVHIYLEWRNKNFFFLT